MLKSDQKGATMIEALSVIAIVGVLTIASLRLINGLFDLFKQNLVVSEIRELQKNVRDRYGVDGNYNGLKAQGAFEKLLEDKVIPTKMISGNKIYHSLNGEVSLGASALADYYFEITFYDVSSRGCLNLSQINWSNHQGSDLVQIDVNGTEFVQPVKGVSQNDAKALPMTMDKASKVCKSGRVNNITWTFQ